MSGSKIPNLDDMVLFALVVDTGGFSAASRQSSRPQATVSRRIAALEAQLGMQLLDRSTRRTELTEAGRRVYQHAVIMREQAEAAQMAVAELGGSVAGDLKVSAPVIIGQALIAPVVAQFLASHPEVNVLVEWTTRSVDPAQDDIDVAIQLGNPANQSLICVKLGTTRARLVAPPGYDSPPPGHPSALSGHAIAGLGGNLDRRSMVFTRGAEVAAVELPRRLMANDVHPVIEAALACQCLALLPDFCIPPGWTDILPDWSTPEYEIHALRTASRGALPKVRLFIEALRQGMAGSAIAAERPGQRA